MSEWELESENLGGLLEEKTNMDLTAHWKVGQNASVCHVGWIKLWQLIMKIRQQKAGIGSRANG